MSFKLASQECVTQAAVKTVQTHRVRTGWGQVCVFVNMCGTKADTKQLLTALVADWPVGIQV